MQFRREVSKLKNKVFMGPSLKNYITINESLKSELVCSNFFPAPPSCTLSLYYSHNMIMSPGFQRGT